MQQVSDRIIIIVLFPCLKLHVRLFQLVWCWHEDIHDLIRLFYNTIYISIQHIKPFFQFVAEFHLPHQLQWRQCCHLHYYWVLDNIRNYSLFLNFHQTFNPAGAPVPHLPQFSPQHFCMHFVLFQFVLQFIYLQLVLVFLLL